MEHNRDPKTEQSLAAAAKRANFVLSPHALLRLLKIGEPSLDKLIEDATLKVDACYLRMAGMVDGEPRENARRRLQHHELQTTYLSTRIRALTAVAVAKQKAVAKLLPAILSEIVDFHTASAELALALQFEEMRKSEKAERRSTGLYANAREVVDRLHDEHQIEHWHLKIATDGQLQEIARILRNNHETPSDDGS